MMLQNWPVSIYRQCRAPSSPQAGTKLRCYRPIAQENTDVANIGKARERILPACGKHDLRQTGIVLERAVSVRGNNQPWVRRRVGCSCRSAWGFGVVSLTSALLGGLIAKQEAVASLVRLAGSGCYQHKARRSDISLGIGCLDMASQASAKSLEQSPRGLPMTIVYEGRQVQRRTRASLPMLTTCC